MTDWFEEPFLLLLLQKHSLPVQSYPLAPPSVGLPDETPCPQRNVFAGEFLDPSEAPARKSAALPPAAATPRREPEARVPSGSALGGGATLHGCTNGSLAPLVPRGPTWCFLPPEPYTLAPFLTPEPYNLPPSLRT